MKDVELVALAEAWWPRVSPRRNRQDLQRDGAMRMLGGNGTKEAIGSAAADRVHSGLRVF